MNILVMGMFRGGGSSEQQAPQQGRLRWLDICLVICIYIYCLCIYVCVDLYI
jgi:hypothetical protein